MKIKVPHYKVLNTTIEVDLILFEAFSIQTKGEINSNQFLLSLWHELDTELGNKDGRCPWAYFPNRYKLKKNLLSFLGIIDTTLGHFYVAISYQKKGDIDSIHFYSQNCKTDYKTIIKGLVKKAIKNIDNTVAYIVTAELTSVFQSLFFYNYSGDNFDFFVENEKNKIKFQVNSIDKFEATQLTEKRLRTLTAFLAIETNIHFDYDNVSISDSVNVEKTHVPMCKHQEEVVISNTNENGACFIDEYPIFDYKILISKTGIEFLNNYVFVGREYTNPKIVRSFLQACIHFQKGLSSETAMIMPTAFMSEEYLFAFSPVGIFNKQAIINNATTFYLSSIEVLSYYGSQQTTCKTCHQVQYKIGQRVADFIEEYFNNDLSKVFKKLYNNRSKFLHTGESSSSNLNTYIKPMMDLSTASGLKDYGFITVNINGNCSGVYTSNVREWTSYCFRQYYREKILMKSE